jgi:hypothetical protein
MSDEHKTTQAETYTPRGGMSFAEMMEKMMGQQGCGCPGMMSQMMGQQDVDCDCASMMSMCGGASDEEDTATEGTQKA